MTTQQLNWAVQHDWYVGHGYTVDDVLFIRVRNDMHVGTLDFTDYQALREWSGY